MNPNKLEKLKKMNVSQILELVELSSNWFLPEEKVQNRIKLVEDSISHYSSSSGSLDKFFKLKGTINSIKLIMVMAHLKPISDEMLTDYILGLKEFMSYQMTKKGDYAENCEKLMRPSLIKLREFILSDLWRSFIIDLEVTGQECQMINGMSIPFTSEAIKMHISRIRALPIFTEDIAKIKADLRKYNERLYQADEMPKSKTDILVDNNKRSSSEDISIMDLITGRQQFDFDFLLMERIHSACIKYEVIKISRIEFLLAISLADFSRVSFIPEYKGQHLIYRLSKVMGDPWYSNVTSSCGWKKSECSSHGVRLESNRWAKTINAITKELETVKKQ